MDTEFSTLNIKEIKWKDDKGKERKKKSNK